MNIAREKVKKILVVVKIFAPVSPIKRPPSPATAELKSGNNKMNEYI